MNGLRHVSFAFIVAAVCSIVLIATPSGASATEWQLGTAYAVNALVTYQGPTYKCLQAHTSQPGWEPPNTPALWQLQSGTPTPTPTATSTPTVTPSSTVTATPTNIMCPTATPPAMNPVVDLSAVPG